MNSKQIVTVVTLSLVMGPLLMGHQSLCGVLPLIEQFCISHKPYQDVVINGAVVVPGWNTQYCTTRYAKIKDIIKKNYGRIFAYDVFAAQCPHLPLTVLDLGAAQGYFSFKLAHDFGFTCVMIEDDNSAVGYGQGATTFLKNLCMHNDEVSSNMVFLHSTVCHKTLNILQRNDDRFDVILALSMIHYLDDWQLCIDKLIRLGNCIIIELPNPDNGDLSEMINAETLADMHNYIIKKGGEIIIEISRFFKGQTSTFYVLQGIGATRSSPDSQSGISRESFLQLNGQWPEMR